MKKCFAVLMIMIISIMLVACGNKEKNEDEDDSKKALDLSKYSVGDIYTFGTYEQDDDKENGHEKIEWIILDKRDGKALLISKCGLDCQKYNNEFKDVTWEQCDLRKWLNDTFLNEAFAKSEKKCIATTDTSNESNPEHDINGGNDTKDKVFILSISEANRYFKDDEARLCPVTEYAKRRGTYTENGVYCAWWLRTPGDGKNKAACVGYEGAVKNYGRGVDHSYHAVRPAIWVYIKPE
jgi:major membrane immunogen (membrane-anchored lipoprotein)